MLFALPTVEVPGSRWAWPRRLDGVQPGDSLLVYAELDEGKPLRVQFKTHALHEQKIATGAVVRPLLERAWRGAQLRDLVDDALGPNLEDAAGDFGDQRQQIRAAEREAMKKEIVDTVIERTQQIQKNANGGRSLGDLADRVGKVESTITEVRGTVTGLDSRLDVIEGLLRAIVGGHPRTDP